MVRPSVNGPVRVDVFHDEAPPEFTEGLVPKLEGVLETPSSAVTVHDFDDSAELRAEIGGRDRDDVVAPGTQRLAEPRAVDLEVQVLAVRPDGASGEYLTRAYRRDQTEHVHRPR
ncbi:hypothetical protein ACQPXB_18805 [Amycolatopsis sp. CA-161197]|uniref:hypothetical protein n=1 Tax=Amycolatopsis sp. CA-161197 TaxID=3239922 RepID=UPI003D89EF38